MVLMVLMLVLWYVWFFLFGLGEGERLGREEESLSEGRGIGREEGRVNNGGGIISIGIKIYSKTTANHSPLYSTPPPARLLPSTA